MTIFARINSSEQNLRQRITFMSSASARISALKIKLRSRMDQVRNEIDLEISQQLYCLRTRNESLLFELEQKYVDKERTLCAQQQQLAKEIEMCQHNLNTPAIFRPYQNDNMLPQGFRGFGETDLTQMPELHLLNFERNSSYLRDAIQNFGCVSFRTESGNLLEQTTITNSEAKITTKSLAQPSTRQYLDQQRIKPVFPVLFPQRNELQRQSYRNPAQFECIPDALYKDPMDKFHLANAIDSMIIRFNLHYKNASNESTTILTKIHSPHLKSILEQRHQKQQQVHVFRPKWETGDSGLFTCLGSQLLPSHGNSTIKKPSLSSISSPHYQQHVFPNLFPQQQMKPQQIGPSTDGNYLFFSGESVNFGNINTTAGLEKNNGKSCQAVNIFGQPIQQQPLPNIFSTARTCTASIFGNTGTPYRCSDAVATIPLLPTAATYTSNDLSSMFCQKPNNNIDGNNIAKNSVTTDGLFRSSVPVSQSSLFSVSSIFQPGTNYSINRDKNDDNNNNSTTTTMTTKTPPTPLSPLPISSPLSSSFEVIPIISGGGVSSGASDVPPPSNCSDDGSASGRSKVSSFSISDDGGVHFGSDGNNDANNDNAALNTATTNMNLAVNSTQINEKTKITTKKQTSTGQIFSSESTPNTTIISSGGSIDSILSADRFGSDKNRGGNSDGTEEVIIKWTPPLKFDVVSVPRSESSPTSVRLPLSQNIRHHWELANGARVKAAAISGDGGNAFWLMKPPTSTKAKEKTTVVTEIETDTTGKSDQSSGNTAASAVDVALTDVSLQQQEEGDGANFTLTKGNNKVDNNSRRPAMNKMAGEVASWESVLGWKNILEKIHASGEEQWLAPSSRSIKQGAAPIETTLTFGRKLTMSSSSDHKKWLAPSSLSIIQGPVSTKVPEKSKPLSAGVAVLNGTHATIGCV